MRVNCVFSIMHSYMLVIMLKTIFRVSFERSPAMVIKTVSVQMQRSRIHELHVLFTFRSLSVRCDRI
ncbi:hypothetical protein Hanom_Chr09g00844371 [Helianthus anomalus]